MNGDRRARLAALDAVRADCRDAAVEFLSRHGDDVDAYRKVLSDALDEALAQLVADVRDLSGGNAAATGLAERACEYAGWMQWSLWDMPAFAVTLGTDREDFKRAVTGCGLVYIAIRLFDDVVDQHHYYKGRHQTLLGALSEDHAQPDSATALCTLGALLLCFDGLSRLAGAGREESVRMLDAVVASIRRAVVGAMMEGSGFRSWTMGDYQRLVRLKNVDYWRSLYAAVDPDLRSPLHPFLERYYELAQYLNDIGDLAEDLVTGQPNLLALRDVAAGNGACRPFDPAAPDAVPPAVEALVADAYIALADTATDLPRTEQAVARYKLSESLETAYKLGLFADTPTPATGAAQPPTPRLQWYSDIDDVIEEAGTSALRETSCPVCGGDERRTLFRKQGFPHHRCTGCSHVYVSPHLNGEAHRWLTAELGGDACEDEYLEVQRLYAESICDELRRRVPGPRLLDLGFGRGYLLQMGQLYGFEVHGLDASQSQVDALRPQFGERVAHGIIGNDAIPWDGFDVVVMSHVLEHLADPRAVLSQVRERMNPDACLYVAVPDLESVHFTFFGKRWDAINPLAHLQHFTERSLSVLLGSCAFEQVERFRHPSPPDELCPRWMRLMRQLRGSESSELVMLARVPGSDG